ncbi:N-lysine methyltransferase KMT5A-like [Diachasma alloeum]|uniref:N-lysine methyltransferase KMT5A-like n=1 Tax=Diachasma alloeum TaxID=454923 RepID=UPI0010FB6B9A|nr:N-lysine methyltransferase KMT5A-like [Diachasma alloeum]
MAQQEHNIQSKIQNGAEEGLSIKYFEDKGRGMITTQSFLRGEFVVEYAGELIDWKSAEKREIELFEAVNDASGADATIAFDPQIGWYMYYFKHHERKYCVDATTESGKLGRLINHSCKENLKARVINSHSIPHLVLFATREIAAGQELTFDYGERRKGVIDNHPWLRDIVILNNLLPIKDIQL